MKYHFTFCSMYRESKKIAQDGKRQSLGSKLRGLVPPSQSSKRQVTPLLPLHEMFIFRLGSQHSLSFTYLEFRFRNVWNPQVCFQGQKSLESERLTREDPSPLIRQIPSPAPPTGFVRPSAEPIEQKG